MHFRAAPGATLRTTAVQMRLTDVNLHLRKLQILGLYGSEKKARGFSKIFRGTPRSARGRSAIAIAEFGTYDY